MRKCGDVTRKYGDPQLMSREKIKCLLAGMTAAAACMSGRALYLLAARSVVVMLRSTHAPGTLGSNSYDLSSFYSSYVVQKGGCSVDCQIIAQSRFSAILTSILELIREYFLRCHDLFKTRGYTPAAKLSFNKNIKINLRTHL